MLQLRLSISQQSRTAVMIMVSGWMEEDEDDKRTFGVIPSEENLGLKVRTRAKICYDRTSAHCCSCLPQERLIRFYRVHDPARLQDVEKHIWDFSEDPAPLYAAVRIFCDVSGRNVTYHTSWKLCSQSSTFCSYSERFVATFCPTTAQAALRQRPLER